MRHLISPLDFTVEETYEVLDFADRIAANPKAYAHAADGRQLATLFKSQVPERGFLLNRQCSVLVDRRLDSQGRTNRAFPKGRQLRIR